MRLEKFGFNARKSRDFRLLFEAGESTSRLEHYGCVEWRKFKAE